MTMSFSTSATRFCYAVTAALPIMCCLATAQHAVKRERSTLTSVRCRTDSGSRSAAPPSMRNQSLTRSSHVHAHLLPSPTTFRTGIIDLGSHALQCNTVLSCAERTPLKSTCCHALQCNTVLSCITMPARCDGITKQSWFRIPMTMLLSTSATRFSY